MIYDASNWAPPVLDNGLGGFSTSLIMTGRDVLLGDLGLIRLSGRRDDESPGSRELVLIRGRTT